MKIFKNKFLVKLIAALCLLFTLINCSGTSKVYADDDDEVWGGILLTPIVNLMTAIGDGIMELLHQSVQSQDAAIIKLDGSTDGQKFWGNLVAIIVGIIVAVAIIAVVTVVTAGIGTALAALGASASVSISAFPLIVAGAAVGICAGKAVAKGMIPEDLYLPAFSISAEEIFANEVPLFDVNFFEEKNYFKEITTNDLTDDKVTRVTYDWSRKDFSNAEWVKYNGEEPKLPDAFVRFTKIVSFDDVDPMDATTMLRRHIKKNLEEYYDEVMYSRSDDGNGVEEALQLQELLKMFNKENQDGALLGKGLDMQHLEDYYISTNYERDYWMPAAEGINDDHTYFQYLYNISFTNNEGETVAYYEASCLRKHNMMLYAEDWTGDQFTMNVTKSVHSDEPVTMRVLDTDGKEIELFSIAQKIRGIVSTWYYILRGIALVVLMLVLIYIGIRIVIGSTAGEKAKYKERLMDWLVALCLLFVMHYIMVFAVEISEQIIKLVSTTRTSNVAVIQLTDKQKESALGEKGIQEFIDEKVAEIQSPSSDNGNESTLVWQTDLAGLYRIQSEMTKEGTGKWVGYSLCYVVLVLFTLFFAFAYAKRVVYMAFLTMIAPLVAMTYPIDKITDGKAQAFDAWFKEYIFNLLIQPLHLLLYVILVTSAFDLATQSPVYALVALGFMMPAEKLMRRFFGFEKAKTPGLLGGAAGAALTMSGLQSMMRPRPHGRRNGDNAEGSSQKSQNNVKFANRNNIDEKAAIAEDTPKTAPAGNQGGEENGEIRTLQSDNPESAPETEQTNGNIGNETIENSQNQIDETKDEGIEPGDYGYNSWDEYDNSFEPFVTTPDNEQANNEGSMYTPTYEQTSTLDADIPQKSKDGKLRRIGRAVGSVMLAGGKQMAVGALRGIHPLRLAGRVATAATLGTAGLLLGTASGDPTKAFQYTTAGIVGGNALAKSLSGRGNTKQLAEEAKMAYYGPEYKEKVIEERKKAFQRSQENINYLRQTMGVTRAEAEQILETTGGDCFDKGITDIKDVATIHKLTKNEDASKRMSFEKAMAARKYAKTRLGGADMSSMDQQRVEQYKARWQQEFMQAGYDYNQSIRLANKAWDSAAEFDKVQSGLEKKS